MNTKVLAYAYLLVGLVAVAVAAPGAFASGPAATDCTGSGYIVVDHNFHPPQISLVCPGNCPIGTGYACVSTATSIGGQSATYCACYNAGTGGGYSTIGDWTCATALGDGGAGALCIDQNCTATCTPVDHDQGGLINHKYCECK